MSKKTVIFVLIFIINVILFCEYDARLCKKNEKLVYSFLSLKQKRVISVCMSIDNIQNPYIVFRCGKKDKIELEFPKEKVNSFKKFTYSYYLRGGGPGNSGLDLNYLKFKNDHYTFKIYDEYSSEDNKNSIGLKIVDFIHNKENDIKADIKSKKGSLADLRFDDRIRKEEVTE